LINQILIQKILRFGLFISAATWFAGISSPCFDSNFINSFYPLQKQLFSTVCHQSAVKSFICSDLVFLVCARCTGIYAGALFSAFMLMLYYKPFILKTKHLLILSAPMLLDVILLNIGVYNYNKSLASLTGFLFGSAVFLYILSAIENLLFTKHK
jgi:uncharacterized membrane protein